MKYIVIATVDSIRYMVNVEAESHCRAEHSILDLGYCGRHEYGVESAQAFDQKDMKTDTFIAMAMQSTTISLMEIMAIISEHNLQIERRDIAEKRIAEIERQMKMLSEELESQKKILAA